MRWMDYDGNGTIDGSEFLQEFWKFGEPSSICGASARRGGAREGPSAAAARSSGGLDDPFFHRDAGNGHADAHGARFEGGQAIPRERGRGFGYGFRPLAHDPRPGLRRGADDAGPACDGTAKEL